MILFGFLIIVDVDYIKFIGFQWNVLCLLYNSHKIFVLTDITSIYLYLKMFMGDIIPKNNDILLTLTYLLMLILYLHQFLLFPSYCFRTTKFCLCLRNFKTFQVRLGATHLSIGGQFKFTYIVVVFIFILTIRIQ